jgi:hypothetical protein
MQFKSSLQDCPAWDIRPGTPLLREHRNATPLHAKLRAASPPSSPGAIAIGLRRHFGFGK